MRPTVLATTVVVSKTAAWARDTEAQLDSGEKEVSEEDEAHKGSTSWAGLKHWNTGCLSQMGLNPNSPGTYIFSLSGTAAVLKEAGHWIVHWPFSVHNSLFYSVGCQKPVNSFWCVFNLEPPPSSWPQPLTDPQALYISCYC